MSRRIPPQDPAVSLPQPMPAGSCTDSLGALRARHATLRRRLDQLRRAGGPVPRGLCARLATCEADMMEAQFDNMPV